MSARKSGLISVVVTAYNRRKYITNCLQSLIGQTYSNIELIVINDGSTDETWKEIKRFERSLHGRRRARFIGINLPRNTGYAGALTFGMYLARGKYIAIQDSDDTSHPERLERQVKYLRMHPEIGIVGTNYRTIRDGRSTEQINDWLRYGPDTIRQSYAEGRHCICFGTLMIRGEVFDNVGGLNRRMNGAEDYEWVARCLERGFLVDNLPNVLYDYHRHTSQRSNTFYGK